MTVADTLTRGMTVLNVLTALVVYFSIILTAIIAADATTAAWRAWRRRRRTREAVQTLLDGLLELAAECERPKKLTLTLGPAQEAK